MSKNSSHWVELRIHGVSGTPPESMLCSEHAAQVAGNEHWRIFRPTDTLRREVKPPDGHLLEGFHWGQFTSGTWRHGLWLLLVPFGFINAAQFMLPPADGRWQKLLHSVAGALIRLIGLCLTCTFAFAAGLIGMDLLARRVAGNAAVASNLPSGVVLGAGLVAASALICGLAVLGNQRRPIGQPPDPPDSLGKILTGEQGLAQPDFFAGNPDAPTLSRMHLSSALSLITVMGILALSELRVGEPSRLLTWATLTALLLGVLSVFLLGDPEKSACIHIEGKLKSLRDWWHRLARWLSVGLVAGSGVLLLCAAIMVTTAAVELPPAERFTSLDTVAELIFLVMTTALSLLLIAGSLLAVATRPQAKQSPDRFRPYALGLAAPVVSAIGVFVGVGYAAAFAHAAATWGVDEPVSSPVLNRVAHAWGITVVAVMPMTILLILGLMFLQRWCHEQEVVAAYGKSDSVVVPENWISGIATARSAARLKNLIPVVFSMFAVAGVVLSVAAIWEVLDDGPAFRTSWLDLLSSAGESTPVSFLVGIGSWSLVSLAGFLLLLGRRAIRAPKWRRGVNIIWDVVSFWPHSAHPFVPPAYSQVAVQQLRTRIQFHQRSSGRNGEGAQSVVLAAHSQGSLIAFAALLWLTADERARVGLVTYGSQLQVAFARAFPAYVNYSLIAGLHDALAGRWVNLYRDTDPIAGPVLSWCHSSNLDRVPRSYRVGQLNGQLNGQRCIDVVDICTGRRECGDDWRLLDPAPTDVTLQTGRVDKLLRHSDFPLSPDWDAAVRKVRGCAMYRRGAILEQ